LRHRPRIIQVAAFALLALSAIGALVSCGDAPPAATTRRATDPDVAAARSAAEKALDDGRVEDAVRLAEFAAKARDEAANHELHGRALLAQASKLEAKRDATAPAARRAAAQAYRKAAELDAKNAPLQDAAAMVLDSAGDAGAARTFYDRAVAAAPGNASFLVHRANARLRAHDLDGATIDAKRLNEIAPDEPWSHAIAAALALERGDAKTAIDESTKARALAPAAPEFRLMLARSLRAGDRPKDALELLIGLPPEERVDLAIAAELAAAWSTLDRFDKAGDAWELAHTAHPNDVNSALEAARARLKASQLVPARAMIDEVKRIAPNDASIAALERELTAANVPHPPESSRP
jgi:tetratricopeptide (TPR) repeat protein